MILTTDVSEKNLRRTAYSTAITIGPTLHEHKSLSHVVWEAWQGIAKKNLTPVGLCNVGYPSATHLKLKSRKILLVHNIPFSFLLFLIFRTEHVSLLCNIHFKTIEQIWDKLRANKTSHDMSLRYVSDRYPIYKVPDCDPEPQKKLLTITCSKYDLSWFHENLFIHYPWILLKDERKQLTKHPAVIFKSPRLSWKFP